MLFVIIFWQSIGVIKYLLLKTYFIVWGIGVVDCHA